MDNLIYFKVPPHSLAGKLIVPSLLRGVGCFRKGIWGYLLEVAVSMNLKRVRTLKDPKRRGRLSTG